MSAFTDVEMALHRRIAELEADAAQKDLVILQLEQEIKRLKGMLLDAGWRDAASLLQHTTEA